MKKFFTITLPSVLVPIIAFSQPKTNGAGKDTGGNPSSLLDNLPLLIALVVGLAVIIYIVRLRMKKP